MKLKYGYRFGKRTQQVHQLLSSRMDHLNVAEMTSLEAENIGIPRSSFNKAIRLLSKFEIIRPVGRSSFKILVTRDSLFDPIKSRTFLNKSECGLDKSSIFRGLLAENYSHAHALYLTDKRVHEMMYPEIERINFEKEVDMYGGIEAWEKLQDKLNIEWLKKCNPHRSHDYISNLYYNLNL